MSAIPATRTLAITPGGRANQALAVLTDAGVEVYRNTFNPDNTKSVGKLAADIGIGYAELNAAVETMRGTRGPVQIDARPPDARPRPFSVWLRGIRDSESVPVVAEEPIAALLSAIAVRDFPRPEPVIRWDGTTRLAALDVDYHAPLARPSDADIARVVALTVPRAPLYWVTHGGGLRFVFTRVGRFDADELAAVAAVSIRSIDPNPKIEIKSETRHPAYPRGNDLCGPVVQQEPTTDLGAISARVKRSVSDSKRDEWLSANGYELGRSYPHERCPIRPNASRGEPVFVGDVGIACAKCKAQGFRRGFIGYDALIPGGVPSMLRRLAANLTHWTHARPVLENDPTLSLRGPLAELTYRAICKLSHEPDDPRIPSVFTAGVDLVRASGYWVSADLTTAYTAKIAPLLAKLPAAQFVTRSPTGLLEAHVDKERVSRFLEKPDITAYGYPPIVPIRGIRIYSHHQHLPESKAIPAVVVASNLKLPSQEPARPQYLAAADRMPIADVQAVYESVFPGINFSYLQLLICAKGCAEGQDGQPPLIAVSGVSGSGKTHTVHIAASTCGDANTEVLWSPSAERFRQGILEAGNRGSYATCNEIGKDAMRSGKTLREAFDMFLNLTPDSVSHKLYTGPVEIGILPVCVVTETRIPQDLRSDTQIARRFVHIRLPDRVDWQDSTIRAGVKSTKDFRALADHVYAANSLVSYLIDRYFRDAVKFTDIAADLGVPTLEDDPEFDDPQDGLRRFFRLVCESGALYDGNAFRGRGWKVINRDIDCSLLQSWKLICDDEYRGFSDSRQARSVDWRRLMGSRDRIEIDIAAVNKDRTIVRFRSGDARSPETKYNERIEI